MNNVASKVEPEGEPKLQLHPSPKQLDSYADFLRSFPLQGDQLYLTLFDRHADIIQTRKARFAVANLQKIFAATFEVSAVSGFDRMSLRDLSRSTGMSMGAIYSCISKKEDIALMVADIVGLSSELTRSHAMNLEGRWARIEQSIRFHLYASTLLQPWYFFLYFETRSLPETQQRESTSIELGGIQEFQKIIDEGVQAGEFACADSKMVANMVVVLLEDWYLKPWKNFDARQEIKGEIASPELELTIDNYYQSLIKLVKHLLAA